MFPGWQQLGNWKHFPLFVFFSPFLLFFPPSWISFKLTQCSVNSHWPSIKLALNFQSKHTVQRCFQFWDEGDQVRNRSDVYFSVKPFLSTWRTTSEGPWHMLIWIIIYCCRSHGNNWTISMESEKNSLAQRYKAEIMKTNYKTNSLQPHYETAMLWAKC